MLGDTRGLFVGGCAFDELPPAVIMEAVHAVRAGGGAVFFDPVIIISLYNEQIPPFPLPMQPLTARTSQSSEAFRP